MKGRHEAGGPIQRVRHLVQNELEASSKPREEHTVTELADGAVKSIAVEHHNCDAWPGIHDIRKEVRAAAEAEARKQLEREEA